MAMGSWKHGRGGSDGTVDMQNSLFQDPHCHMALARTHPFESTLGRGVPREGRMGQFGSRCAPPRMRRASSHLNPQHVSCSFSSDSAPRALPPSLSFSLSFHHSLGVRLPLPLPLSHNPSLELSPLSDPPSRSQSPSRPGSDPGLRPLERSSPPPRRSSFPRPLSSSLIGGSLPFAHPRRPFAPICHPACFHWSKRVHPASWSTRSSFA